MHKKRFFVGFRTFGKKVNQKYVIDTKIQNLQAVAFLPKMYIQAQKQLWNRKSHQKISPQIWFVSVFFDCKVASVLEYRFLKGNVLRADQIAIDILLYFCIINLNCQSVYFTKKNRRIG